MGAKPWSYVSVLIAIVFGNLIYQFATERDWLVAFERSYFQALAVFCCFVNRELLQ